MERNYPYRGYTINVSVQAYAAAALNNVRMRDVGFAATVTILRDGAPDTRLHPMQISDRDGRWFASEADALLAGGSAGQRAIDALGDAAAGRH